MNKHREALSELASDFIADRRFECDMRLMFHRTSPGQWMELSTLVDPLLSQRIQELQNRIGDKVYIAWMYFPQTMYGYEMCTIHLFCEKAGWNWTAEYNKSRLDREC